MPSVSVGGDYVGSSYATSAELARIPTAGLRDGDQAYCSTPNQYWRLSKGSTTAVGANVVYADIALNDPAKAGRWVLIGSGSADVKPTQANKNMAATATAVTTGLQVAPAITYSPVFQGAGAGGGSWVQIVMDGVCYGLGDGVTTDDFYFADPAALGVAKTIRGIVAGDVLVRGSGFLVPTDANDRFSYLYNAIVP